MHAGVCFRAGIVALHSGIALWLLLVTVSANFRVEPDVSVHMGEQVGDPEARAGGEAQQKDRTAAVEVMHASPPVRPQAVGTAVPLVDQLAV